MKLDIWFILLCISLILIVGLGTYIARMKNKKQIHYAFLSLIIALFCWSFSLFLAALNNFSNMIYVYAFFVSVCYVPISIVFLGLTFAYTNINFNWKYILLFIFPIIDSIIIITNPYHKLFLVNYSPINTLRQDGIFYVIHTSVSYIYILIGLGYLLYYSIKNSGFFSRQSFLIAWGVSIPLALNVLENFHMVKLTTYTTPVAFSFAILCFAFAIFKFDFLNVVPIALQRVVDLISDGYVVLNENLDIIDYNKTLIDTFDSVIRIKRKDNFIELLKNNKIFGDGAEDFRNLINMAVSHKKSVGFEKHVTDGDFDKHFTIEITPIFSNNSFIGTVVLFKDITEHKKNIEIIKETQDQLVEKERLASLGQLIGGIAHNLKTPIMSMAGGFEALDDLVKEYDESIDDKEVTSEDHHEIAKEMAEWVGKLKPYLSYMSDVITTVKDQAVQLNDSTTKNFTLDEVIKRVDILMKHELKQYYCKLNMSVSADSNTLINGEANNLVQVFNNLITNAIYAYDGKGGEIDFTIVKKDNNIEFRVKDYGKGIADEIKDRLFKEMVTTKGKNGTGLGLYMSYSTIKGRFGGDMWFESEPGKGTTFFIIIPISKEVAN